MKDSGYGIFSNILSLWHSPNLWIETGANVDVCFAIFMFSSYQVIRIYSALMENGSHATTVHDVGTVYLKFTSRKTIRLKNMHHVTSINKNLVSEFLLCRVATHH
jgi:hypothetical protein